jgi:dynein heavy chain 1
MQLKTRNQTIRANIAVKAIKKEHLQEIRRLPNPPTGVKLAIESICTLLGEDDLDWKSLRQVILRENFIPTIVNFDADHIS